MNSREIAFVFIAGMLVGLYVDEVLSAFRYREWVKSVPEIVREEGEN